MIEGGTPKGTGGTAGDGGVLGLLGVGVVLGVVVGVVVGALVGVLGVLVGDVVGVTALRTVQLERSALTLRGVNWCQGTRHALECRAQCTLRPGHDPVWHQNNAGRNTNPLHVKCETPIRGQPLSGHGSRAGGVNSKTQGKNQPPGEHDTREADTGSWERRRHDCDPVWSAFGQLTQKCHLCVMMLHLMHCDWPAFGWYLPKAQVLRPSIRRLSVAAQSWNVTLTHIC